MSDKDVPDHLPAPDLVNECVDDNNNDVAGETSGEERENDEKKPQDEVEEVRIERTTGKNQTTTLKLKLVQIAIRRRDI